MGLIIDMDLFILGSRRFGPPLTNCFLVQWGYNTQQHLMWAKIVFLIVVYVLSSFMSIFYSIFQLRKFDAVNWTTKTMNDYVARIQGLPKIEGTDRPEVTLKQVLEAVTGKSVVGVSLAWVYNDEQEADIDWLVADWLA